MNEGLFTKYLSVIKKRQSTVQGIIEYIFKESGITLIQEEIVIEKKTISFQTSSVKKMLLKKKSIQCFLQEKGYTVKM